MALAPLAELLHDHTHVELDDHTHAHTHLEGGITGPASMRHMEGAPIGQGGAAGRAREGGVMDLCSMMSDEALIASPAPSGSGLQATAPAAPHAAAAAAHARARALAPTPHPLPSATVAAGGGEAGGVGGGDGGMFGDAVAQVDAALQSLRASGHSPIYFEPPCDLFAPESNLTPWLPPPFPSRCFMSDSE
jgi:hypothetical protein